MKYLVIIILLASCGKKTPQQYIDMRDTDGDQIVNALDEDPYIADIDPVEKLNGTISISLSGEKKQFEVISFTNEKDLDAQTEKLLTQGQMTEKIEDYFTEWNQLRFSNINQKLYLNQSHFDLRITFSSEANLPSIIVFKSENEEKSYSAKRSTVLNLSQAEILSLAQGKSQIWIRSNNSRKGWQGATEESIKEKTYRIFLKEKSESKILYVSTEVDIQDFLIKKNIYQATDLNSIYIPFEEESLTKRWWIKQIGKGDFILAHLSLKEVQQMFKRQFRFQDKISASRENGKSKKTISLSKPFMSTLYFKLSASKSMRTFFNHSKKVKLRYGGEYYECLENYTSVKKETLNELDVHELISIIEVKIDEKLIDLSPEMFARSPLTNHWFLKIEETGEKFTINLKDQDKTLYRATGLTSLDCGERNDQYAKNFLSPESYAQIDAEAYIENVE